MNDIQKFVNDPEKIKQTGYTLSHFIIATIFVVCLKKFNPILLLVLLTLMLIYLCYTEQTNIPIYMLPLFGLILYVADSTIMATNNDILSISQKIKNTLWKLPYYGILIYYVMLF